MTVPIGKAGKVSVIAGNSGGGTDTLAVVNDEFLNLERDVITATVTAKDKDGNEVRFETTLDEHC